MNKIRIAGAAAGVVLVSGVVLQVSSAAFTDTTENAGNDWTAGTVTLTDNDDGFAMYESVSNITPGYTQTECIDVTYGGSVSPAEAIELYAATTATDVALDGTDLSESLAVTVQIGASGSTCANWALTTPTQIFDDTLSAFNTSTTPLSTGWQPDPEGVLGLNLGTDMARAFQFTVTLPSATGNEAQGDGATADFTWSATS